MNKSFPALQEIFPVTTSIAPNGNLTIADHDLVRLASDFKTPLYLIDAETVRGNIHAIQQTLHNQYPGESSIAYASKAYFSARFATQIATEDIELDVVSYAEAMIALQNGFNPDRLHIHGNNKSREELTLAIEKDFHAIVIDNFDEIDMIDEIATCLGKKARVWLRITPDIDVATHPHISTAALTSKFGFHISNGEAERAIRLVNTKETMRLTGLHCHLGSMLFDADAYVAATDEIFNLALKTNFQLEEYSPGGGWGVRYTPDAPNLPLDNWIKPVSELIVSFCQKNQLPLPKLCLESGRYIIGRAGVALYSVGTVKDGLDGRTIVAVDGGMADNPRHALYEAVYSAAIVENPKGEFHDKPVRVVGKFCESGDQLIEATQLPLPLRDQHLAIPVSGAYQLSMASNYNLAPRPAVLWLEPNNTLILLQARENPEILSWWL